MGQMFPGLMIFSDPASAGPNSRSPEAERTGFSFSIDENKEEDQWDIDTFQKEILLQFGLDLRQVALWRQRRLVAAESASLALVASPKRIADEVSRGLGRSEFASNAVTPSDLEAPDREQLAWCRSVLHELDAGYGLENIARRIKHPV